MKPPVEAAWLGLFPPLYCDVSSPEHHQMAGSLRSSSPPLPSLLSASLPLPFRHGPLPSTLQGAVLRRVQPLAIARTPLPASPPGPRPSGPSSPCRIGIRVKLPFNQLFRVQRLLLSPRGPYASYILLQASLSARAPSLRPTRVPGGPPAEQLHRLSASTKKAARVACFGTGGSRSAPTFLLCGTLRSAGTLPKVMGSNGRATGIQGELHDKDVDAVTPAARQVRIGCPCLRDGSRRGQGWRGLGRITGTQQMSRSLRVPSLRSVRAGRLVDSLILIIGLCLLMMRQGTTASTSCLPRRTRPSSSGPSPKASRIFLNRKMASSVLLAWRCEVHRPTGPWPLSRSS